MKKILIISILITVSFAKNSNINIQIHGGLGNIYNQNIGAISVGYSNETAFFDRVNANIAIGIFPYFPTIGFNGTAEFDFIKNNSLITGFSWEFNHEGGGDSSFGITIPIAYKLNFNINDNFDSFVLLGFKLGNKYRRNDAEETVTAEDNTAAFLSMGIGIKF